MNVLLLSTIFVTLEVVRAWEGVTRFINGTDMKLFDALDCPVIIGQKPIVGGEYCGFLCPPIAGLSTSAYIDKGFRDCQPDFQIRSDQG